MLAATAGLLAYGTGLARAFELNVVDHTGAPVSGVRWVVEYDRAPVIPGVPDPQSPAVSFHQSHAVVAAAGESTGSSVNIGVPGDAQYMVSVLPFAGHSMGGAAVAPGQNQVTVTVPALPLRTAQISVFVFEDNQPINNAADLPEERGLGGPDYPFDIILFDAAGRYGQAGGQVSQDVFGNPLGTEYDANGNVTVMGSGMIRPGPDGVAHIKYLFPGKYSVEVAPPPGQDWHQTSTIEGTPADDAWVKANEPSYFAEFGPPGHHVSVGFVRTTNDTTALNGTSAITGRVVNLHTSRPPDFTFYAGQPLPDCWIGLNSLAAGAGTGIYAAPCNADSTFRVEHVPAGSYQLVVWDHHLDNIIATLGVTVPPGGGDVNLLDVPVFRWFSSMQHEVFFDRDQDGFRDCVTASCEDPTLDEVGIPNQNINLRFRDGTVYQSFPTNDHGFVSFDEVFPFFHWLIAEVDFARFKATGATVVVDAGGPVLPDAGWSYPSRNVLNPQPQVENGVPLVNPNTGNNLSRTVTGPVLLQAVQGFLGQTNVIQWGKAPYAPGENGGITGIVYYATTRAENDPQYAAGDAWEPGVPRVQVNLYQDNDKNGVIDDLDGDGAVTPADVDNYPFDWTESGAKGAEDVDHDSDSIFDPGDAVQITTSDSWDDNRPEGCQGEIFYVPGAPGEPDVRTDCYDGLRNFNQVRDGVFDGGYAFATYHPGGIASGSTPVTLPAGDYIVEAAPPPGYEIVKEEDKNVDFGDVFTPASLLPSPCVGDLHVVPEHMSFQTDALGDPLPGIPPEDLMPAPFAGQSRPLCNRKTVALKSGQNAATDFHVFTRVPKAARMVGFILDDLSNEFDPNAPMFGEKFAPPWLPVSVRDFTGREIVRVYADEYGKYETLLPSTYSVNVPSPSGVSPAMLTACMNDPGPIPNPNGSGVIVDPYFNRQYSQFCYTFQFMPGTTTYLDTPVIPIAAFAGPNQFPLDCEIEDQSPMIYSVSGPQGGPYALPGNLITMTSSGDVAVPNPAYGAPNEPKTITRDYGFGASQGTVTLTVKVPAGDLTVPLTISSWSNGVIQAVAPSLPAAATRNGQLTVTRSNGLSSPMGVTLTVGPTSGTIHRVAPSNTPGATPIQSAIDAAQPGDLILVAPGTYEESVIMWKPVRLQGWGAASTIVNAVKRPSEKIAAWRDKVVSLVGQFSLVPGQEVGFDPNDNEPLLFTTEEAPGVLVAGLDATGTAAFGPGKARVDGFTITGSDGGGGVFVNGYANGLTIANNRVIGNYGTFGGGIRLGHPNLTTETNQGLVYSDASNDHVTIHHNHITQNGTLDGAGAGVAIYTGSDDYQVVDNDICGNFAQADGGGVGHLGLSNRGLVARNRIRHNQSFNQGTSVSGGGVFIGGAPGLGGAGSLTPGAGSVTVDRNLIQGNLAGAGDGGGIRTELVNGEDVADHPNSPNQWYAVNLFNNIIVDNIAGLAGGGISMQDTARIRIFHDTVAHNDSTATAGEAFLPGNPNQSTPQPAGIVSRAHSQALAAAFGNAASVQRYAHYANPDLENTVVWQNRTFYWYIDPDADPAVFGLLPDVEAGQSPVFDDLAVLGYPAELDPRFCILTDATGYHASNIAADPLFVSAYFNGDRGQTIILPGITTSIATAPAFDEGGNFIDVRFGPLTKAGNYHLGAGSPARNAASNLTGFAELDVDFDGQSRPNDADIGADELP